MVATALARSLAPYSLRASGEQESEPPRPCASPYHPPAANALEARAPGAPPFARAPRNRAHPRRFRPPPYTTQPRGFRREAGPFRYRGEVAPQAIGSLIWCGEHFPAASPWVHRERRAAARGHPKLGLTNHR